MRRGLALLIALLGCAALCDVACAEEKLLSDAREAIPVSFGPKRTFNRCRRWELSLEAGGRLIPSPEGPVGVASGDPAQFRWDALDYPPAVAFRLGARYALNARDHLHLQVSWNAITDDAFVGTGVIGFSPTPGGIVGTTAANTATFRGETESQIYELGWWRCIHACCPWRVEAGGGLRVYHFHEPTRVTFATPFPGLGSPTELRSLGHNFFVGLQPGAKATYTLSRRLEAYAGAKVFAGGMLQDLEVSDLSIFTTGPHTANRDRFVFAWGADVEVGLRWHLNACWSLTAAYNLFFFDSVVRGYDAYDFAQSATGAVQSQFQESTLLLHTIYVGAAYRL